MTSFNSAEKENHTSIFDNIEYDLCIFCGGTRTEITRKDFTIMFLEYEHNTKIPHVKIVWWNNDNCIIVGPGEDYGGRPSRRAGRK